MGDISDTYLTIEGEAEAVMRERSSKFYSFAYHVENEEQIAQYLDTLHKQYYDATHHCYAWRLGPAGERFRANDDGEPSGTAGRPILGQMLSHGITDALIVVVRYFGGTKLGVPGLIAAYRQGAADAIEASKVVERTVDTRLRIDFSYTVMNDVMRIVKEEQPDILEQSYDMDCRMTLRIRRSMMAKLRARLEKVETLRVEDAG